MVKEGNGVSLLQCFFLNLKNGFRCILAIHTASKMKHLKMQMPPHLLIVNTRIILLFAGDPFNFYFPLDNWEGQETKLERNTASRPTKEQGAFESDDL